MNLELFAPSTAKRIEAVPKLRGFLERIDSALSTNDESRFWECRTDFEDLLRSHFLEEVLRHELANAAGDSYYSPPSPSEGCLELASCSRFEMTLLFLSAAHDRSSSASEAQPARIRDSVEHRMIGVVGPGSITVQAFHQRTPLPHDVLDHSRRLAERGSFELPPGKCLALRALEDVVAVRAAGAPTLLLTIATAPTGFISWEYDRATLAPTRMVSADLSASRLEHTLGVIAELDDGHAVPALLRLIDGHPSHQIRWAAVSAVARLHRPAAIDALQRLTRDSHPDVRDSARRALGGLEPRGFYGADN